MAKKVKWQAFATFAAAAAGVDLVIRGVFYLQRSQLMPEIAQIALSGAGGIPTPWQGGVFGLLFAIGAIIVYGKGTRLGLNEVVGMVLLCALAQLLCPTVVAVAGKFLASASIPLALVINLLYAILLATIARGLLYLDYGIGAILITGVIGALCFAASAIKGLPIYPAEVWYFFVGSTIGFFAARY